MRGKKKNKIVRVNIFRIISPRGLRSNNNMNAGEKRSMKNWVDGEKPQARRNFPLVNAPFHRSHSFGIF